MTLSPTALAIVTATAEQYGVSVEALLTPNPPHGEVRAARVAAFTRLDQEKIDGEPRWGLATIAAWFGISRTQGYEIRRRSAEYAPRREAKKR